MAATAQIAHPARTANPIALWHLLSLDAPTVAALWTWFVARACHIALPPAVPVAMALAVWILYAADRLLDTRPLRARHPRRSLHLELEPRHLFHHRHYHAFLGGIALSAAALTELLPRLGLRTLCDYLLEAALLVVWFAVLHSSPNPRRLPKEVVVGLFFAAAVFMPAFAHISSHTGAFVPAAILAAALCSLNCFFIHAWEHAGRAPARLAPQLFGLTLALAIAAAALAFAPGIPARPIPFACALSAALLLALDRNRHRLSRTNLRAAADLALLTPLLLLPFLR